MPKGNKKTDSQRNAEKKYKSENYKVAACQISKEKYAAFQEYAKSRNKTISGLLSEYINNCLSDQAQANE